MKEWLFSKNAKDYLSDFTASKGGRGGG
jgi:hypothetical protein